MAKFAPAPPPFMPLLPLETRLLTALHAAAAHESHIIAIVVAPAAYPRVRAGFLRWLLAEAIPRSRVPITQIQLGKALIDGRLDLRGTRLRVRPTFHRCVFDAPINLTEATVPGFALLGGSVPAIHADRMTARGSLLIRSDGPAGTPGNGIAIKGAIRLNGATIHGNFNMEGARLGAELAEERGPLPPRDAPPIFCVHDPAGPDARFAARQVRGPEDGTAAAVDHRAWVSLEADGLSVDGHLRCVWPFRAKGELRLDGCRIGRNLDCAGACLENFGGYTLSAAGAHVAGTAYFGSPFHEHEDDSHHGANPRFISRGAVRIDGARIDGDLDCSDGCFIATAFLPRWNQAQPLENDVYALKGSGLEVGANVRLAGRFEARGNVSLLNARIGRDLHFTRAHLDFPGGEALCCDGISVAGVVFLTGTKEHPFRTSGLLRFVLADVKQGFYVRHARFDRTGPVAPLTENLPLTEDRRFQRFAVPEDLWLRDGYWTSRDRNGLVRHACGIYADDARIGGTFLWKSVSTESANAGRSHPFWLHVSGATAEVVDDDVPSWAAPDRFDIANCRYQSLAALFEGYQFDDDRNAPRAFRDYVSGRLALLDREYAPARARHGGLAARRYAVRSRYEAIRRFKPQPYLQLARVLRAAGLDKDANKALARLESNRTRYGGFFWPYRLLRGFVFGFLLRYGFGWSRPALALLVWAALSSIVFQVAYSQHRIEPSWHNRNNLTAAPGRDDVHVAFNPAIFALDTLVPLVDLNQKDNWEVEPLGNTIAQQTQSLPDTNQPTLRALWSGATYHALWQTFPDRLVAWLIIFNRFFGWLLTTLFAGGVTGVLRGGREPAELPGGG